MPNTPRQSKQLLHLVFGGELRSVSDIEFKDTAKLDILGIYPNYASAYEAWRAKVEEPSTTRRSVILLSICTGYLIPALRRGEMNA